MRTFFSHHPIGRGPTAINANATITDADITDADITDADIGVERPGQTLMR